MLRVQKRIAQRIILVGELNGGLVKYDALLHAVTLGEGTGGEIADNDLQRHNGDLPHQGIPVAELPHKMGGNPGLFQPLHQAVAHLVVDDALAGDGALFQSVEGRGIVLIGHNQQIRIIRGIDLFGLAFIKLFSFFHVGYLLFIYRCHRSLPELLPRDRSRCSPPTPCWASRNPRPSHPGRDNTSQRSPGTAKTPW